MLAGYAYCVATCSLTDSSSQSIAFSSTTLSTLTTSSSSLVLTSTSPLTLLDSSVATSTTFVPTSTSAITSSQTISSISPVATAPGVDVYKMYTGDGSIADGWPAESEWVSFEYMFEANTPNMKASCSQWGVPDDSDEEVANVKTAIQSIASSTGVDERFILAIIMQESTGCVRVITTEYSVFNPGLMQSHNGTGTCNTNNAPLGIPGIVGNGVVQTPCPYSEIYQMIEDGTAGTASGDGLEQCIQQQGHTDVSRFYRAARMYNGGSIAPSGDLGEGCCTACYASDIANRLTGWVNAPHDCTL
ncbi:hypothetical protein M433DRAFT_68275 [Acidomyces richmondensis BFW]|nr:MAG: hypothetical protein FE78DRAFT_150190 [Acidomyces sp. 'richmondensis']KYG44971.1 hypothetical protein M433DRAFT_68275 [Acidomyces richmondensis BFW]